MATILSIDPGGSKKGETGIALGHFTYTTAYRLVASWAVPDNILGFHRWFWETWLDYDTGQPLRPGSINRGVDVVVCEKWVDRGIRGADRSPMLVEGAVRFLWPDTVLQPASGKNTAVSDEVLKNLGVYTKGGHHHDVREATRHAVLYLKNRQQHLPTIQAGWPSQPV